MADDLGSGVDPRFNPAFQRGFVADDPAEDDVPEVAPGVSLPSATVNAVVPETADGVDAAARAEEVPSADAEPIMRIDAGATDAGSPASEVPVARNPYLIALLVVALLLIAAGIWLFVNTESQFDSSQVQSQGDYISLTSLIEFAPFLALVGGVIIIGVLFIFALRYRRRP
jgi:uncharacterized membrane protein YidH (DUF202 family)